MPTGPSPGLDGRLGGIDIDPKPSDSQPVDGRPDRMPAGPNSTGAEFVGRTITGPNLRSNEPADELVLLWRALLLGSGDPAAAERALLATVDALRPWSDRPARREIWLTGFDALWRESEDHAIGGHVVHVVGGVLVGGRADEINEVVEFLQASPPDRRMALLGHRLGGFRTGDLQRLIAAQPNGRNLDESQLAQWIERDRRIAAETVTIKPEHWLELMALSWPPVAPARLLRTGSRRGKLATAAVGVVAVALLFVALFSFDRGIPVARPEPGELPSASGDGGGGPGSESAARSDLGCPAEAWADQITVSAAYHADLRDRAFTEALDEADAVVRGSVTMITADGDGLRFGLAHQRLLEGSDPVPDSFWLPTGALPLSGEPAAPAGLTDVVVFLKRVGGSTGRWEVSPAGGLWAECVGGRAVPVGAAWPTGPDWPARPGPSELSRALTLARQETVDVTMTAEGDWTVGAFPLLDGRIAVLQLPAGMQPVSPMTAIVRPPVDGFALISSPVVGRLVLRQQPCDPLSQESAPLAVCTSSGEIVVDIASPLRVSDTWLERIDVFIVDPDEPGAVAEANHVWSTRSQGLVAVDPTDYTVAWRTPLKPGERLVAVGESTAAVVAGRNLRVVGRASGLILWTRTIDPGAGLLAVGTHWLLGNPDGPPSFLELVEGRTGALLWRTAELPSGDLAGQSWLIDPTGRGLVEVSREVVRLLDVGPMEVRWSTLVEGASFVEAISEVAVIVRGGDGTRAVLDLEDGAVLAVGP